MPNKDPQKKKEHDQLYYQNNKERFRLLGRKWRKKNPERASAICKKYRDANKKKRYVVCKKWRTDNLGKIRKQYRENPKIRIDGSMRSLIWLALKGKKAGLKWESLVGYTIDDLMKHLEKQFDDKMTWDNYGNYWWIDHIKARSLFKYETAEDQEFKKCWALENLQPLEKIANIKKKNH